MEEINKQYNGIGENYINWQQKYFSENQDLPLYYIENAIWDFENQKILDLWCWDWHDISYFESKYKAEFWWIDSSEFMISQAKWRVKNPEKMFILDFDNLDKLEEKFDIVYAKHSIQYLSDLDIIFDSVSNILKDKWKFIFVVNHPINDYTKKKEKYPIKEVIEAKLFWNQTTIKYYNHTISEIISKKFLNNFVLQDLTEDHNYRILYPVPNFIWITAIKN